MKSVEPIMPRFPRLVPSRDRSREFLPAALEIIETPASPAGRATGLAIIAFFAVALIWSWFGYVDIIATAPGKIVPAGKVKVVQPLEAGIVRAIHVQDGARVRAGDVLIELDGTATSADRDRLTQDLLSAQLDVARLVALQHDSPERFAAPAGASGTALEQTRAVMQAQAAEQAAKLAAFDQQIGQKRAEAQEVAATLDKLQAVLPVLSEKEKLRKQLLDIQYGNRFAYLDAQQQLLEARHDVIVQDRRAAETTAAQAALERQRDQTRAEYARQVLSDLADAQQQVSQLTQELVKATRKSTETTLTAPIDGVVQQLAIHTVGGVVTPAQPLLVVVPEDSRLVVEAMVANRDVGFVHAGQEVEVKVETFTFTRYGLVAGWVIDVSHDVVTDDQRKPDRAGETETGKDQTGGSPAYVARVALDRTSLMVEGQDQPLGPGMAVTAEIKTGSRRILDYLLSPIREYAQDAGRER
jgi:hemolysin D